MNPITTPEEELAAWRHWAEGIQAQHRRCQELMLDATEKFRAGSAPFSAEFIMAMDWKGPARPGASEFPSVTITQVASCSDSGFTPDEALAIINETKEASDRFLRGEDPFPRAEPDPRAETMRARYTAGVQAAVDFLHLHADEQEAKAKKATKDGNRQAGILAEERALALVIAADELCHLCEGVKGR